MRWFQPLLSVLLAADVLAATKSSAERFQEFHKKALSSAPVALKDSSYTSLLSTPRDYSVVVLLTALDPRIQCQLCHEFKPEWDVLARSWVQGDRAGASRTIFATLDFADGRNTFLTLGLQTAPVLFYYPPTSGPYASSTEPSRYDFTSGLQTAENVHSWIVRHSPHGPHPPLKRPINYTRVATTTTAGLGIVTFLAATAKYVLPVLRNRNLWAAVTIMAVVVFSSGHMFNHIRKVPYIAGSQRGGVMLIAPNFQSQFGLETQIVAAIYGVLSFCTICLAIKVPRIESPTSQKMAVVAASAGMFLTYSALMAIFRIKNSGYPFSLPPFM